MLKKRQPLPRKKRGFTLVELLVVITIITILAGLSMAGTVAAIAIARDINCRTNLSQIHKSLNGKMIAAERYPGFVTKIGELYDADGNLSDKRKSVTWFTSIQEYQVPAVYKMWVSATAEEADVAAFEGRRMIEGAVCPSNKPPGMTEDTPFLSYKLNGDVFEKDIAASILTRYGEKIMAAESLFPFNWNRIWAMIHPGCINRDCTAEKCPRKRTQVPNNGSKTDCVSTAFFGVAETAADLEDEISSNHSGGVNILNTGGSVEKVSNAIDPAVYSKRVVADVGSDSEE